MTNYSLFQTFARGSQKTDKTFGNPEKPCPFCNDLIDKNITLCKCGYNFTLNNINELRKKKKIKQQGLINTLFGLSMIIISVVMLLVYEVKTYSVIYKILFWIGLIWSIRGSYQISDGRKMKQFKSYDLFDSEEDNNEKDDTGQADQNEDDSISDFSESYGEELLKALKEDSRKAIDTYKEEIKHTPDNAEAHFKLGDAYASSGNHELFTESIEAYKQAIRLKPNYSKAYSNLSFIYSLLNMNKEALMALQEVIKINPKDASAYFSLGAAYLKLNIVVFRIKPAYLF